MKISEVTEAVTDIMTSVMAMRQSPEEKTCLVEVNEKKCTGCGLCVKDCGSFSLEVRDEKVVVVAGERCSHCGHCVAICPTGAMKDKFAERNETPLFDHATLPSSKSLHTFFRARRTVREYRDKPISQKDLDKILDAGRYAPTAGNRQDAHFVVLTTPEDIAALRDMVVPYVYNLFLMFHDKVMGSILSTILGKKNAEALKNYIPILDLFRERWEKYGDDRIFFNAPAIILVHGTKFDDTVAVSCSFVIYQASLMAQALNIGTCFNGFLQVAINRNDRIRRWLGIPWGHKCYGAMTLGYQKKKYKRVVRREPPKVTWR